MRGLEHSFVLHANASQIVGIAKAPIVNVVGGDAPVRQAEGLCFDELMKFFEACGISWISVDRVDHSQNASHDLRRSATQLSQPSLMNLLVAIAFGDTILIGVLPCRQVAKGGDQALKLE